MKKNLDGNEAKTQKISMKERKKTKKCFYDHQMMMMMMMASVISVCDVPQRNIQNFFFRFASHSFGNDGE